MGKSSPQRYTPLSSGSGRRIFYLCYRCGNSSKACCISTVATLAFCLVVYYIGVPNQQQNAALLLSSGEPEMGIPRTQLVVQKEKRRKFVVETSSCRIPEMNPFDSSISNFLKPDFWYPVDCKREHKKWTFVNGTELLINTTAVHESGYSMSSIYCCYRIIERIEQPTSDFDKNADNYIKYSEKCHFVPVDGVNVYAEYIRVHCISKLPPFYNDVVYRDFFAIAQSSSDRLVASKLYEWKAKLELRNGSSRAPPNVVIIGIDNNSRMNSHRNLPKTLNILRNLGAVEMLGYTKVAENTFPNTVPFLTGYSEKQLQTLCYQSNEVPQDNCPHIWKAFDKAGKYLTVHAEDTPYLGGFNYLKTGFIKKPTDFYLRPLMLAVMTFMKRFDYYHTDCIGRYMTDEFTFNYILDVIRLATTHGAPVFVHNWLTSLAHHSYNNLQFGDGSISEFIQSLVNESQDNTVFFFMSDHGQRYGPIRETSQGWYEDKLPTQWVYIPEHIRKSFPEWETSLWRNSGRLTSHFDVYKTMLHILKTFSVNENPTSLYASEVLKVAEHQYGLSLFERIPENRTCAEAGITVNFCACSQPKPMDVQDAKVLKAANTAVKHLAALMPLDVCAHPTLKKIVTAGYLSLLGKPVYVLTFVTDPGDFLFEVNVEKEMTTGELVITTDLLRMNKISRATDCVKTPLLERYCYCK